MFNQPAASASEEAFLNGLKQFVIGVAKTSYATNWATMSSNLNKYFVSLGSNNTRHQQTLDALQLHLPQIRKILEACYDANENKMLSNLEEAMNSSVPM